MDRDLGRPQVSTAQVASSESFWFGEKDGRPRKPRLDFVRATGRGAQIAGSGEPGTHGESSRARSRRRALARSGHPLLRAVRCVRLGRWDDARASERDDSFAAADRTGDLGISGSGRHWMGLGRVARAWAPRSGTSPPHHRIYRNNPPGHTYTEYMSMACVGSFFFLLVLFASWLIVVFFSEHDT